MNPEQRERPGAVEVAVAKPADAERIVEVSRDAWIETYPNAELGITRELIAKRFEGERLEKRINKWRERLEADSKDVMDKTFVAREDGRIVGFCWSTKKEEYDEIEALYVAPEKKRSGIGKALVKASFDWFESDKPVELWVTSHNKNAIAFYESLGFKVKEGTKEHDLGDGKTMTNIRMVRSVKA